jgi:hypothetical protein
MALDGGTLKKEGMTESYPPSVRRRVPAAPAPTQAIISKTTTKAIRVLRLLVPGSDG